ncbi:MAG: CPBP family intramembrane metalloprotease [Candidatus Electrothrix sp. MAN1_4]|nr:CPBP family intramembrane metalloprotease [Candidatus Electrothrix sp. MAN1_4]
MEFQGNQPKSMMTAPVQPTRPQLRAGRAFALFALFFATQLLTGLIIGFAISVFAALRGANLQAPDVLAQINQQVTLLATIVGFVLASFIVISLAIRWFPKEIQEGIMTGAAWKIGQPRFLALGFGVGPLIAISYLVLSPLMSTPSDENALGPFAKMATTPGLQQIVALFIALILAPPVEELLFRGVMFGGICQSFGPIWAAILTTVLFVASHIIEAIHFWPAFLFIALMALAALWLRIFTKTIGPSIALHFSYNLFIFSTIFFTT